MTTEVPCSLCRTPITIQIRVRPEGDGSYEVFAMGINYAYEAHARTCYVRNGARALA